MCCEELIRCRKLCSKTLQLLENMVLYNKIRLQDIPREIRLEDDTLYIYAFRLSSRRAFPCERFIEDLNTLCEDICSLEDNNRYKYWLVGQLSDQLSINEHKEDERIVNYEKNLNEEVLRELLKRRYSSQEVIKQQLKNFGIE